MNTRTLIWIRVAWVAATVLLMAVWREEALVLFFALAFLGPLVREAVPPVDEDERARTIDYRASHYALMAFNVILFVLIARALFVEGQGIPSDLLVLFVAPLLVRIGLAVGRSVGPRRLGAAVGFTAGAVWLAFTVASHGLSLDTVIESAIGGAMLVATALALRWPRTGGALLVAEGVLFLALVVAPQLSRPAGAAMAAALALPPIVAGIAFLASAAGASRERADEFADLRPAPGPRGSTGAGA